MLILFIKKIKSNSFENVKKLYENLINIPYIECPNCNSSDIIKWGSYERNIYYVDEIIKYERIKIQRVRCKSCGKTHALLPSFIIPYKQHLLDVILYALNNNDITNIISIDTINKWKKQFRIFIPYLKTMMRIQNHKEILSQLLKTIHHHYETYYQNFRRLLMMMHKGIYKEAYF